MSVAAIIQARMGSTRLPGKILEPIGNRPALKHVIDRVAASNVDEILVATTDLTRDDPVEQACNEWNVPVVRGPEEDVLARYHMAAQSTEADWILRITADCPLMDPAVINAALDVVAAGSSDLVSNAWDRTYPDGLDVEVFSRAALNRAHAEATDPNEREHVTAHFYRHAERFNIHHLRQPTDRSHWRWTLDRPDDLAFLRTVEARMRSTLFGQEELAALLEKEPDLHHFGDDA